MYKPPALLTWVGVNAMVSTSTFNSASMFWQ